MTGDELFPAPRTGKQRGNGEGTVYKRRDGRYEGACYVLMTDGTVRRKRVYARTRKEVVDKLAELQKHSRDGVPMPTKTWTVTEYLAYWLEHVVRPNSKPKTHQGYEVVTRVHVVPVLGKKRLTALQAADIRLLLTRVQHRCRCCAEEIDAGRPERGRRCCAIGRCCESYPSARTLQQVHAVFRNALQNAVREELVMRNVAKLVRVPSPKYRVHRGITADQAHEMIEASVSDRLHALYVLTLYLGMRRAELLGLRWADVDLDGGHLEIVQTLQRVDGELRFVPAKTTASERTLPLVGRCWETLRKHRAAQAWETSEAGDDWTDHDLVFPSRVGTPLEPDNLRRSWYPLRKKLGVESTRFHDLRHTCVTLLLDLGVPPHIVREIAGHSDIGVTMRIYAHASLDEKRAALRKLDGRIG
ncbi:site-specific recombinase XerD [Pseudonocardia sediminis]|uniref:Site-specific recombinase XerD n=1 Tax=Pseudonocardia sediminis TaxID=1397368 RepID=A0A4Q7UQA1_PSEST|nr:site-specific integrase [Pseudonocardia sediminis]RZT83716.1 site-specific recombinase XerD [Pseudonocardia sediminis]